MKPTSKFHAKPKTESSSVRVWDAPVRVFHWLLILCFVGAYLSAESERWRLLHVTLGYSMAGLVAFRILWGLIGSRYARFSNFVRAPAEVFRYVQSLIRARPQHYLGHNPVGALAILALLTLALLISISGWALYNHVAVHGLEDIHEALAQLMLVVVGVHVAGVLVSSWLHGENLIGAMITGRKHGPSDQGIRSAWRSVAALLVVAVVAFWWFQWENKPSTQALVSRHHQE